MLRRTLPPSDDTQPAWEHLDGLFSEAFTKIEAALSDPTAVRATSASLQNAESDGRSEAVKKEEPIEAPVLPLEREPSPSPDPFIPKSTLPNVRGMLVETMTRIYHAPDIETVLDSCILL